MWQLKYHGHIPKNCFKDRPGAGPLAAAISSPTLVLPFAIAKSGPRAPPLSSPNRGLFDAPFLIAARVPRKVFVIKLIEKMKSFSDCY